MLSYERVVDGTTVKWSDSEGSVHFTKRGWDMEEAAQYEVTAQARKHGYNLGWWRGLMFGVMTGGTVAWLTYLVLTTVSR